VALEGGGRGSDDTLTLRIPHQASSSRSPYSEFASFEQGNLEEDLLVIRRLDPSVDFLRMRHIPLDVLGDEDSRRWADRTAEILSHVRARHATLLLGEGGAISEGDESQITWTRREAVASLFWSKLVALLEASRQVGQDFPVGDRILVHTAFASPCFLPAVARLVANLYPEEMAVQDRRGRLPLHYAAAREWHDLDWPPEGSPEGASNRPTKLFQMETLTSLRLAMELSTDTAASVADFDGRLPLDYMVESFILAASRLAWGQPVRDMLDLMKALVKLNPDALYRRDGATHLYPCFQATAVATKSANTSKHFMPEIHLSIPYILLREDPTLLSAQGALS